MARKRQGPAPWVTERNRQFARHLSRLLSDASLNPGELAVTVRRTILAVHGSLIPDRFMWYREICHARDQLSLEAAISDRMMAPAHLSAAIRTSFTHSVLPADGRQYPEVSLLEAAPAGNGCGWLRLPNQFVRIVAVGRHRVQGRSRPVRVSNNRRPWCDHRAGDRAGQQLRDSAQRLGQPWLAPGCNQRGWTA